jgi:hypothetical protein
MQTAISVRFDVITAVRMTMLFRALKPCRLVGRLFSPDDGDSMFLRNAGMCLQVNMVSEPRRTTSWTETCYVVQTLNFRFTSWSSTPLRAVPPRLCLVTHFPKSPLIPFLNPQRSPGLKSKHFYQPLVLQPAQNSRHIPKLDFDIWLVILVYTQIPGPFSSPAPTSRGRNEGEFKVFWRLFLAHGGLRSWDKGRP